MLNAGWHWFVVILTLANIFGCWWLLRWSGHMQSGEGTGTTGHRWDGDLEEMNNPLPRWWLWLFHFTIIFSLVYIALFPGLGNFEGFLGWTQVKRYDEELVRADARAADYYAQFDNLSIAQLMQNEKALGVGQRTFANHCAMCHGSDGGGASGFPRLNDQDWLYGGGHESILISIQNGRNGVMPPFGAALGEQGVWEVVAYVQSLSRQAVSPGLANKGKQHFATLCVACHGPDGTGNQALGSPNLTDNIWLYGSSPEVIAETVINGRNNNMPAHGPLIGARRVPLVAAYVARLAEQSGE